MSAQPTQAPTGVKTSASARAGDRVKAASDYTARHLSVLEGLEAVRKRPGMYIGSTDSRGLMHCLWEIIDNAMKLFKGKGCDKCNNTGYKGRVGLYEVMEMNDTLRELILVGASNLELRKTGD